MNIIDPILLVLLSLFALRGYFKGLFRESFSLLGLFIGFMVAVRYDEPAAVFWGAYWKVSPILLKALSFVLLFFVVYFSATLAGWLLHRSARLLSLQSVNRIGGIVMGTGKGAAVLAMTVFFLVSFPLMPRDIKRKIEGSYLAPPLAHMARGLIRIGRSNLLRLEEPPEHAREGTGI